jgi:hypothetical protein
VNASNGSFMVAEGGGDGTVNANRGVAGPWEAFRIINLDGWGERAGTGRRVRLS